jgi:peptidoglycan-associated lipoprotein
MKSLTKLGLLSLVAVLAIASGCSKKPKNITPIPGSGSGAPAPVTNVQPSTPVRPAYDSGAGNRLGQGNGVGRSDLPTGSQDLPGGSTGLPTGNIGENRIEDAATLAGDTVYFDYDKSAVKAAEASKVTAVADYLKAHTEANLKVAGHADERGTEEYNRALSERRALAVREQLINGGISPERITTEPYGEDKPADPGHDEAAWAKNRRAEFILLLPANLK